MADYAHPEVLVSTEWVAQHRTDPNIVIAEVDVDTAAYNEGHIPGAIGWAWNTQLCDTVRRDILSKQQFEELMASSGISNDTTVILYGDNNNWFAAWAFWQMKIYGHKDVRIMNGGRKKWLAEGRELSTEIPQPKRATYKASDPDLSLRAFLPQVQVAMKERSAALVDVRSPQEFTGEILAPPGLPETCQRGGHIPGARNIPWGKACNEDGTFKSYEELKELYRSEGIDGSKPIIAYCRIGERSSHTWFVLKYLLGFNNVSNYDGSWTEWGNLVGAPIERGAAAVGA
ncbi:MAG: sulfurtransferase [Bryobacterales bacterium]|nr:sulfurtransferase [Bryobacteraceae bacterium]MDW8353079.1 sulfurtransferase [Bryobacterales bacterium]